MKAVILSALPAVEPVVNAELARAGYDLVVSFDLTPMKLAYCQGEFDCWVKTPGKCRSEDAETEIVGAVHDADALVLLGPVTFGGHGYILKRAVDRLLCLLEPFFVKRVSLTHHGLRYDRAPKLFSIGWLREPSVALADTFAELNDANAINYFAPACGALVLDDPNRNTWVGSIRELLACTRAPGSHIDGRAPLRGQLFAAATPDAEALGPSQVRKASLLIGSPKIKGTSASEAMARALGRRLEAASVATDYHFATEFVHDDARARNAAASIARSDLFALITPLYVDSFPSLTTHALELVADARSSQRPLARFMTLVNCGFPEPEQTRTAVRIARHFADQAGYAWAGALPLGGGGVVAPGSPLDAPGGPTTHVVRALDLAAAALAKNEVLPISAIEAMAAAPLPDAVYRFIADMGWRWQAHKNGLAQRDLHARPLDV